MLGAHPEGARKPEKSRRTGRWNPPSEIDDAFRRLLGGGSAETVADGDAVVTVLDDFIVWCRENRALRTADRYEDFCQNFVKFKTEEGLRVGELNVYRLTTKHVTAWLCEHPTWNSTSKHGAITALQRGFNWAVKNRGLKYNPIKGMEKPKPVARKEVVTPEEFKKALEHANSSFADLLIVSYDSGSRPQELKKLEKRHVQLDKRRAVIPAEEAKGGIVRAIYFPTDRSMEVITRLCAERPEGKLFLNTRGRPWTGFSVKLAFERLQGRVGRRIRHYELRRTFITRKIIAGVDSHVVAKLSGHTSTAMIDRHYSAVANDHEFLLEQAARDIRPKKEESPKKAVGE